MNNIINTEITHDNNNTNINSDLVYHNFDHLNLYMCLLCANILTTNKPESLCEQCLIKTNIETLYDSDLDLDSDSDSDSDIDVDTSSDLYKIENLCYHIIHQKPYIITNIINNITYLLNIKCSIQSSDIRTFISDLFKCFKIYHLYIVHINIILNRINFDLVSFNNNNWKIFLGSVIWIILEMNTDEWYSNLDITTYLRRHNENMCSSLFLQHKYEILYAVDYKLIIYPDQVYRSIIVSSVLNILN